MVDKGTEIITDVIIKFIDKQKNYYGQIKRISISCIDEFVKNKPKHLNDFDTMKIYTYRLKELNSEEIYGVQIGKLYNQDDETELKSKRVKFPGLDFTTMDRYYNEKYNKGEKLDNTLFDESLENNSEEEVKKKKEADKEFKLKIKEIQKDEQAKLIEEKVETLMKTKTLQTCTKKDSPYKDTTADEVLKENTVNSQIKKIQEQLNETNKKYEKLQCQYSNLMNKYVEQSRTMDSMKQLSIKFYEIFNTEHQVAGGDKVVENVEEIKTPDISEGNPLPPLFNSTPLHSPTKDDTPVKRGKRIIHRNLFNESSQLITHGKVPASPDENVKNCSRKLAIDEESPSLISNRSSCANKNRIVVNKNVRKHELNLEKLEEEDGKNHKDDDSGYKFLEKFVDNGVKMVHLKNDLSMPYEEWKGLYTEAKTESQFAKRMLRYFYPPEDLIRRCNKPGDNVLTPSGKNKRKPISPSKNDAIDRVYLYNIFSVFLVKI